MAVFEFGNIEILARCRLGICRLRACSAVMIRSFGDRARAPSRCLVRRVAAAAADTQCNAGPDP